MMVMRNFYRCIAALLLVGGLAACGQDADTGVIYLVRHAEKLAQPDDPGLSDEGHARAERLAELMAERDIEEIYSTDYRRTLETAEPVARKLGLQVRLYDPSRLQAFADSIAGKSQRILVIGHSNTTPELAELLGAEPGQSMDESEYGRLYRIERDGDEITARIDNY